MKTIGIELNDAAITAVAGQGVVYSEPGYALEQDGEVLFGAAARRLSRLFPRRVRSRYWRDLDLAALNPAVGPCATSADLAHMQLAQLWASCRDADAAVFAVPASWSVDQLGLLLGIAEEENIPVGGLVDAAIACTTREYPQCELVHLELSLHDVAVTQIVQQDGASLGTRTVLESVGVERLERVCAELVAARFVETTRFDPLHDATTEQYLVDHLHEWLARVARHGEAMMTIPYNGNEFDAGIDMPALRERLAVLCEPLLQKLRAMLPAGRRIALQCSPGWSAFPGLVGILGRLPDAAVFLLEPGAAGRGAARRTAAAAGGEGFRLVTALPWDQPPAEIDMRSPEPAGDMPLPSHVLFDARAYRLGERPLRIGAELASGDYGIQLGSGSSGVSRQHCSIELRDGRAIMTDHSRFGTMLNGHNIDGSAVLQPGDVITLGNPPQTIWVIAEERGDGA